MARIARRFRRLGRFMGLALVATGAMRAVFEHRRRRAALSPSAERQIGEGTVRQAGPDAMRDPPANWSAEDEASDGSFPASDSAAKY